MTELKQNDSRWPLSFRMSPNGNRFWSHQLYRGPQGQQVRILYSRTKLESEEIAAEFVNEKIVGFDMEWPQQYDSKPNAALQQRIGLIQIACEDKIALFHIGLHAGNTPIDLLAPSLRRIIESPYISKCGVAVLNADFSRLRQWFKLKPQGAFELSHLHNLVTHGAANPAKCTTRLRKLAKQVEEHLGLPLHKGKVRTSNWSGPLTRQQVEYAASDAYAGLMLYHYLNARRVAMQPSPPLPVHAETYLPMVSGLRGPTSLQLRPVDDKGTIVTALEFFQPGEEAIMAKAGHSLLGEHVTPEGPRQSRGELKENKDEPRGTDSLILPSSFEDALGLVRVGRRGRHMMLAKAELVDLNVSPELVAPKAVVQRGKLRGPPGYNPKPTNLRKSDQSEKTILSPAPGTVDAANSKADIALPDEGRADVLFQRLRAHRKGLACERECAPFIIAHDTLLHAISRQWPRNDNELLRIKGVGKRKMDDFGQAWLDIVSKCTNELGTRESPATVQTVSSLTATLQPESQSEAPPLGVQWTESSAPDHQIRTLPKLHTGLSFCMGQTSIAGGLQDEDDYEGLEEGASLAPDKTSTPGCQLRSPSQSALKRKREQTDVSEEPTNSARPGEPRRPAPPILSDAKRRSAQQQPLLGPDPRVTATTEAFSRSQGSSKTSPSQSLSWSRPLGHSPTCPAAHAVPTPQSQAPSATTLPPVPPTTGGPGEHVGTRRTGASPMSTTQHTENEEARLFCKKLVAFNRFVTPTITLPPPTIDSIVAKPPRAMEELLRVPGIIPFVNECSRANRDFLAFIVKSTRKQDLA